MKGIEFTDMEIEKLIVIQSVIDGKRTEKEAKYLKKIGQKNSYDKKVSVFYEEHGKIKKIQPRDNTYTLHDLGRDCSQSDYIVQIQYKKDSYFLYIDTRNKLKSVDTESSESYLSVVSLDEYRTLSPIRPVKFYNTMIEANDNSIVLQETWNKLIFYQLSEKNFTVEISSEVFEKPQNPKIYKKGKLAVFSFEDLASEFGDNPNCSYFVTKKTGDGDCKYLRVKIKIGN